MASKPHLVVFAGPNGSGKTFLYKNKFSEKLKEYQYINPDEYTLKYGSEAAGARQALKDRAENIKNSRSFVTETTLSGSSPLRLLESANKAGFTTTLIFIGTQSPSFNVERVAYRVRAGGHDVPKEMIHRRYHKSLSNLPRAIQLAKISHIYTVDVKTTRLFSARNGVIRYRSGKILPKWMPEDLQRDLPAQEDQVTEHQANEARSILQNTRNQLYAQWRDPLDERQKAFNVSIRELNEQRREHDRNRPKGLFGFLRMKSWNAQSDRIDSELEKQNRESKQRKEKLPTLGERADRMAREKHPKAAEVVEKWQKVQRKNAQKTVQELRERRNQFSKGRGR